MWTWRNVAWTAALAGLAIGTGLVVAVPPAIADIKADLPYVCTTSSATHEIRLRLSASMPTRGTVGRAISLGRLRMSVVLPAEMAADLAGSAAGGGRSSSAPGADGSSGPGAPSPDLTMTARLGITALQDGQAMAIAWPSFALNGANASDGARQKVPLAGSGRLPAITPSSPGPLTLVGEQLTLQRAGGVSADQVRCVAAGETIVGSVGVRGSGTKKAVAPLVPGDTSKPGAAAPERSWECKEIPATSTDPRYDFNDDARLHEIFDQKKHPPPNIPMNDPQANVRGGIPFCIRASGFANVKKLGGANPIGAETLLRRGVVNISPQNRKENYQQQQGYFITDTTPSKATLLGFGFMPTMATATMEQVRPPAPYKGSLLTGNLRSDIASGIGGAPLPEGRPEETWGSAFVSVRAGETSVNGTPVQLGSHCGTSPTQLNIYTLTGKLGQRVDLTQGSTVTANVGLPAFSGCGIGEDLSPLLTASISGSDNAVQLEAAPWCQFSTVRPGSCDIPREPITVTVKPGGPVQVTAQGILIKGAGAEIRCDSMSLNMKLPTGHWLGRYPFADISKVAASGCRYRHGTFESPVAVTADTDSGWSLSFTSKAADGTLTSSIQGILFSVDGDFDGLKCRLRFGQNNNTTPAGTIEVPGLMSTAYNTEQRMLNVLPNAALYVTFGTTAGCQKVPGFPIGRYAVAFDKGFAFPPNQEISIP
ncbi:hypothetical protein J4573_12765 [Actinomadura barringtoniae]|uniref:Uncharacterized protein n=1 Tax=Actinomadura barringtoniae TaxID=1427535 RepID=A0A939T3D8_9ACTN|nr:hypothetical protein [Actinomadura barringtoniae]MBO2447968.1 hypothetical protein [Actinomadura barringtoniae]